MAVTESRPAPHGGSEPPAADAAGPRRRHPWRRRALVTLGALLAAAAVFLAILAGTYQPVRFGGEEGTRFPGLPSGTGIHFVNTFGGQPGEYYVPPQAGTFTLRVSIYNAGPDAVTIEDVSILSPQQQPSGPPWPLTPAGQVLWVPLSYRPDQQGRPVAGVSLPPGRDVVVGIPLRMSGTCYDPGGWTSTGVFYVRERFLFFTHWVAVAFPVPLFLHEPSNPSGPGAEPARDLICPATRGR